MKPIPNGGGCAGTNSFVTVEGQQPLCNSRASLQYLKQSSILSTETINGLEELGEVLQRIHRRIIDEGYELVDDGYVRKAYEENSNQNRKATD